jgi:hypothetical protein
MYILPHLYTGGWSATIDASKFFQMFKTLAEELPYMGMVHPSTALEYWYPLLPVGSTNSPGMRG